MRHLPSAARVLLFGFVLAAASAPAFSSGLGLTVDLMAPATACVGSKCPSDINLPSLGSAIPVADGGAQMDGAQASVTLDSTVTAPLVCSEQNGSSLGATPGVYHFSPIFTNATPGGMLEFDSGGPSVVDANASNDGFVLAATRANQPTSQVACYPINRQGDTTPVLADSSTVGDRVFYNAFDAGHRGDEPWVSIQTINSPSAGAVLGYVAQIHNASAAVNWHLSFGFDHAFNTLVNGGFVGKWVVLGASTPQPGSVPANPSGMSDLATPYIIAAGDIQSATNSVYVYVQEHSSGAMASAWSGLPNSFYASTASAFAPPGTYAQRLDDKSAVAGVNNLPTFNIGSIVCANDPLATSCTITDPDGNSAPLITKNQVSAGTVTVDPIAYVVDPTSANTGPGSTALAAPSNVTCVDPNGILAGAVSASSFPATTGPNAGARGFTFTFTPALALFVPGTATCTATFTANGLSTTQSFDITMQQLNVTHFAVTADATATAGAPVNFTVTAQDGANNTVVTYGGIVHFTSSDGAAVLPLNSTLVNGVGSFSGTFKTAGSQTFTATDTVSSTIHGTSNNVTVIAAAATHFTVEMLSHATVNTPTGVNVTALDQFNNVTQDYAGTVHFTSTDGAATLPTDTTLTNGVGVGNVTFETTGSQTVTATDTTSSTVTGTSNNVTVN